MSVTTEIDRTQGFIGRERELNLFKNSMVTRNCNESKLISFYGIGGIGKTSLMKEVEAQLTHTYKKRTVDLTFFDDSIINAEKFLLKARGKLGKDHKVKFPKFDLVYILYMKKLNPEVKFTPENLPFIEEGTLLLEFMDLSSDIPYINFIPKVVGLFNKFKEKIEFSSILKSMGNIEQLGIEELSKCLVQFFAEDLKADLETRNDEIVFLIDTYEALWKNHIGNYNPDVDDWVKKIFLTLPNSFWIVFGREPVAWKIKNLSNGKKWIEKIELRNLSESDSLNILAARGIENPQLQRVIYENTKGYPLSISLSIDLFNEELKRTSNPDLTLFANMNSHEDIIVRLMKNISATERQALECLAIPNSWTEDIFEELMNHFRISMSYDDHYDLIRFSFITELDEGHFALHQVMREALLEGLLSRRPQKLTKGHRLLVNYFKEKLIKQKIIQSPSTQIKMLTETFYHAMWLMNDEDSDYDTDEFVTWFRQVDGYFLESHQNHLTLLLLEQLKAFLKTYSDELYTIVDYDIAYIYMTELRSYVKAEGMLKGILAFRLDRLGEQHLLTAKANYGLGVLYGLTGNFADGVTYHTRGLEVRKQLLSVENGLAIAISANSLGRLYMDFDEMEKAMECFKDALAIYEGREKVDARNYMTSKLNYVACLHKLNEFDQALENVEAAIQFIQHNLKDYFQYYCRATQYLAIVQASSERYDEAMENFKKVEKMLGKYFGEEDKLDLAKLKHNMALTLYLMGDDRCQAYMQETLEIKQRLFESGKILITHNNYQQTLQMEKLLAEDTRNIEYCKFNY